VVGAFAAAAARRQTSRSQGKHPALDLALGEAEGWRWRADLREGGARWH
jgi:hypothetical protein